MRKQLLFIHGAGIVGAALVLMGQPALADATSITAIQLNSTEQGLEVVLESSSSQPLQTFTTSYGNTFVVDIINARLNLAEGNAFRQDNPSEGVLSVAVETLDANSIRVTVMGTADAPQVQVAQSVQDLVLSVSSSREVAAEQPDTEAETPATETPTETLPPAQIPVVPSEESPEAPDAEGTDAGAEVGEDGAIRLVVTGEQAPEEGYRVPNATTGTRTNTRILDVPQAIQVVPETVLEDQAVTNLQDALRNVSGISQGNTSGNTQDNIVIRGFDNATILQDGFRSVSQNLRETANLERIEVLQGPASVLFGSGQPGGVVNLVTKQPLSESFYELQLRAGSFSTFRPQFDISGPLDNDGLLLYRLNGVYETSQGFRDFDQDIERVFIAPVLSAEVSDRTNLILEFNYLNDERPFDRGLVAIGDGVADLPTERILGEPDDFAESEEYRTRLRLEHQFSENWNLRSAFQYANADTLTLRAEPRNLNEVTGDLSRRLISNDLEDESYAVQTELVGEFATGSIDHTLLLGIDYSFEAGSVATSQGITPMTAVSPINIFNPQYEVLPRPDISELTTLLTQEVDRTRWGFFLQDQIDLTDNLILVVGGRFDILNQSLGQTSPILGDRDDSGQESVFNPRVGLVYQPIEPISLYASYARSFQPASVFSSTADGEFLEAERGRQYEVGAKADLLDGRLSSTLAFYDLTRTNVAVPDPDAPPGTGFVLPIGEERSRGIGLDIVGEILPGWNVIASYAYIDAIVTESNASGTEVGNRVNNVPRNSASLWTTYEIQAGDLEGLGFGLGFFYMSDREGDPANTFELPSYFRTDAAVFYERDNWRAALNIQNLFDIDYFESSGNTRFRVNPGEPLTIIGTVAVEF